MSDSDLVRELAQSSALLQESERRARALIEYGSEGIVTFDPEGTIVWANPSAMGMLGYTLEAVRGMNMMEFLHPEDLPRVTELFRMCLEEPERRVSYRARVRHGNGSWRMCDGSFTNLLEEPGLSAVVAHFRDVTESLALQGALSQSQKMEAIGRLAGGVAHDFNNLLTAIVGHAELLRDAIAAGSEAADDLAEIEKAAARAAALTKQLLAFSRRQVLEPRVLDLNAVIEGMKKMLQRIIGEDVRLDVRLARGLGHVRADPGQLEQVVLNLAVNARDAMPRGGTVSIETANRAVEERLAHTSPGMAAGEYVSLVVADSGVGMDEETRSRVFEPFFTTKKQGTGLGLATVYGIVRQSGGHITVESELARGSKFTILLPREDAPAAADEERVSPAPDAAGVETVLVVEDEPVVRQLTARILRERGYTVLEASGGLEALEIAERHPGTIHLLLADVVMPDLSGPEVAARLAKTRQETRVLFVSGYTDEAVVKHGVLDAKAPFLAKPFAPHALAAKVRDVLGVPPARA